MYKLFVWQDSLISYNCAKKLKKQLHKNVNMNVQGMWFPYFSLWNNCTQVDVLLNSTNQNGKYKGVMLVSLVSCVFVWSLSFRF